MQIKNIKIVLDKQKQQIVINCVILFRFEQVLP